MIEATLVLDYSTNARYDAVMATGLIPTFYLYGEPQRAVDHGFVHAESLDYRNRPNEWLIHPHSHAELSQIFVIEHGHGQMMAEDRSVSCEGPALILVPAKAVHGFSWNPEVRGSVLTLSTDFLAELHRADPALQQVFQSPCAVSLTISDLALITAATEQLIRELSWTASGHRAAVQAQLLLILVIALRQLEQQNAAAVPPTAAARLMARLRERIETRFRLREPAADYATALGVSLTTLRSASARAAGMSPMALLDERALLEAKRALLYSSQGVAEIAYGLGFADPAYFSRFFSRLTGMSPRAFRERRGLALPDVRHTKQA